MTLIATLLSVFPQLSVDQLIGMIALSSLGLAGFTVYVVFAIVQGQKQS